MTFFFRDNMKELLNRIKNVSVRQLVENENITTTITKEKRFIKSPIKRELLSHVLKSNTELRLGLWELKTRVSEILKCNDETELLNLLMEFRKGKNNHVDKKA